MYDEGKAIAYTRMRRALERGKKPTKGVTFIYQIHLEGFLIIGQMPHITRQDGNACYKFMVTWEELESFPLDPLIRVEHNICEHLGNFVEAVHTETVGF
jgi:hypothetical protein